MTNSDDHSTGTEKIPEGPTSPTFGTTQVASLHPSQRPFLDRDVSESRFIVVMGVSGTGKSTLGTALSKALHLPFIDGDGLHPAANVAKMTRGDPLNDADRQPWLDTIRKTAIVRVLDQLGVDHDERVEPATKPKTDETLTESSMMQEVGGARESSPVRDEERRPSVGVIVACSSLKKTYRAVLRGEEDVLSLQTQNQNQRPRELGSTLDAISLPTYFVYLKGDRDVLMARMQNREGHFMKAGMLESQLNTLESPEGEPGVVTVSAEMSTGEQVRRVVEMFRSQGR